MKTESKERPTEKIINLKTIMEFVMNYEEDIKTESNLSMGYILPPKTWSEAKDEGTDEEENHRNKRKTWESGQSL